MINVPASKDYVQQIVGKLPTSPQKNILIFKKKIVRISVTALTYVH